MRPAEATRFGWEAEKAVDLARKRIAELAGAAPREIVFTSGATESNNLAIKGVGGAAYRHHGDRAQGSARSGARRTGVRLTVLAPRPDGLIDLDELRAAIGTEPTLVSVMYANNEIGVIQPVARDRRDLPRNGRSVPLRRGPGIRQNSARRGRGAYRLDVGERA